MSGGRSPRAVAAAVLLLGALALAACSSGEGAGSVGPERASQSAGPADRPTADATSPRPPRHPDHRIRAGECRAGVCAQRDLAVWQSVPFTPRVPCGGSRCRLTMDIFAPAQAGSRQGRGQGWPLVVLAPGGPNPPGSSRYVNAAAGPVASRGVVVMSVDWRQSAEFGGGYPTSFDDLACAVGVARARGPRYGARGDRVVLAGHSLGGWAAAVVGLSRPALEPSPGSCDVASGTFRPDAVVTLAGAVDEVRNQGLGTDFLAAFFGGSESERPAAWAGADPFALADHGVPAGSGSPTFTVVRGGRDDVVTPSAAGAFDAALRAAGHRSRLVWVPDADHNGLLTAPPAVQAVATAAGRR